MAIISVSIFYFTHLAPYEMIFSVGLLYLYGSTPSEPVLTLIIGSGQIAYRLFQAS